MCFSASASFITAGFLIPAGLAATFRAYKTRPRYLMLALTPLFFGIQQTSEGLVWLSLQQQAFAFANQAAFVFLFFAILVWPSYFAFSIRQAETIPWKRNLLIFIGIIGILFGAILYIPILDGKISLRLSMQTHSICYDIGIITKIMQGYSLIYLGLIMTATLISSQAIMRYFGMLILLSFIASYIWFSYAFTSIWCFFAALLSLLILGIIFSVEKTALSEGARFH